MRRLDFDSAQESDGRRKAAMALVQTLIASWERYQETPDDEILAAHPELLPELAQELRNARMVRRVLLFAQRNSTATRATSPELLSDDELEAPIGDCHAEGELSANDPSVPKVPGCLILGEVRRGGQAVVFRAVQESTGRVVAVKILNEPLHGDSRHRARFEREAQVLAGLRHRHVVDILDRGRCVDGRPYLLMEYVDGPELDQWWASHIARDESGTDRLLKTFLDITRAVAVAHAAGIVHRDLKPSNVRVDEHASPRVLDFGLAKSYADDSAIRVATTSGQIVGSLPWASPEQAAGTGGELTPATDIYSIGVMLYQAMTGEFPYRVEGALYELLHDIAHAEPRPPSTRPAFRAFARPDHLDAIILKALAKCTAHRYLTTSALADDLEALLNRRRPSARVGRPRARRIWTVSALMALSFSIGAWRLAVSPSPPVVYSLPSLTNSIGMRMVRVPGGSTFVGSSHDERGRDRSEELRRVDLDEFYIGVTEVTQAQYRRVMDELPPQQWAGNDLPVHNVRWEQAVEFCKRLGEREHRMYRLPREIEWEYACRAGSSAVFYGGATVSEVGWTSVNAAGRVHPVGLKWPNAWGLFDTLGNVGEWCMDTSKLGSEDRRVVRGGDFASRPDESRAAARRAIAPEARSPALGFRVVSDISKSPAR